MTQEQFGRYQIKEELGRGGMATVYLAYDPRFKRNIAIKVLPRQFNHDPTFRARFEREAQTIASLEHPAIVPVYDFGEEDGQPYLVMRYMPGGSLADRLGTGPLTVAEAVKIVERIGSALDEAHEKGIVHRDLKPGNILFDHHGDAFLSDFGIVKLAEATTTFTGGAIIGTPAYMSPEQVHGEKLLDGRSDLYTLGAILFEVLTGQTPYQADTPTKMMMAHVLNPVPRILEVKHDLPAGYQTVVERAMAKKRDDRYGTANQLIRDLVLASRGEPLPSMGMGGRVATEILPQETPLTAPAPVATVKERRFRNWAWIGGVVVLALSLGGGSILLSTNSGNGAEVTPVPGLTVATEAVTAELPLTASTTTTPTALPTSTTQATSTSTSLPTQTATALPSSTDTPTPTLTRTPTPRPTSTQAPSMVVPPQLSAPVPGEYQNPLTFSWSGSPDVTYQVTLRHLEQGYVHQSNWIQGLSWTFEIPGQQFGNWEWYVTSDNEAQSSIGNFVFNPFPGGGEDDATTPPYPGPPPATKPPEVPYP